MNIKQAIEIVRQRLIKISTVAKEKQISVPYVHKKFKDKIIDIDGAKFVDKEDIKEYQRTR